MPCYDFKCKACNTTITDIYVSSQQVSGGLNIACPKCNTLMERLFPTNVHAKIGMSMDGADVGKVIQEKNEKLKKKWEGYSYEEQNLRKNIAEQTRKRVERKQ